MPDVADDWDPVRAVEDAARSLREAFDDLRAGRPDVPTIMERSQLLEDAWAEYQSSKGLFFEL